MHSPDITTKPMIFEELGSIVDALGTESTVGSPCWGVLLTLLILFTCLQERILFSVIGHNDFDESPDLVLTEDFGGVNAGMGD